MRQPEMVLRTDDNMQTVMDKFAHCDAGTLPVLKPDGTFVGFVSRTRLYASYRQIMKDLSAEYKTPYLTWNYTAYLATRSALAFQHAILLTNLSANTLTLFITTLNMTM